MSGVAALEQGVSRREVRPSGACEAQFWCNSKEFGQRWLVFVFVLAFWTFVRGGERPPTRRAPGARGTSTMSCLPAALEALTHGGCMERASFLQDSDSQPIASLPVYVAHAGRLRRRRRFVRAQLRALGAPDVTMVLCADAEEVARLTVTQRRCLHPDYARTRWSPTSGMLLCRKYARCGWPAPPERLVGRGWPEPGVAWGAIWR